MKRLLLAAVALAALVVPTAAQNHGRTDPTQPTGFEQSQLKINDAIMFSGSFVACRDLQAIDQFIGWGDNMYIMRDRAGMLPGDSWIALGRGRIVSRRAAEQWAAMRGRKCEVRDDPGVGLFVVKIGPRDQREAHLPSYSQITLCVDAGYIHQRTWRLVPGECTWIVVDRQNVIATDPGR